MLRLIEVREKSEFTDHVDLSVAGPLVNETVSGRRATIWGWLARPRVGILSGRLVDGHERTLAHLRIAGDPAELPGLRFPADAIAFRADILDAGLPADATLRLAFTISAGEGPREVTAADLRFERRLAPPSDTKPSVMVPIVLSHIGRDGSTLLMRMLKEHPGIVVAGDYPYEISVLWHWLHSALVLASPGDHIRSVNPYDLADFDRIGRNPYNHFTFRRSLPDGDPLSGWLDNGAVEQAFALARAQIEGYYGALARSQGKPEARFFAEKLMRPNHVPWLVREFIPDAKEIMLVRDLRDWACSSRAFLYDRSSMAQPKSEWAREWIDSTLPGQAEGWVQRADTALRLRYEELERSPADTLTRVLAHIGIETDAATVDRMLAIAADASPNSHRTAAGRTIDRWRTDLDPELVALFGPAIDRFAPVFGYAGVAEPEVLDRGAAAAADAARMEAWRARGTVLVIALGDASPDLLDHVAELAAEWLAGRPLAVVDPVRLLEGRPWGNALLSAATMPRIGLIDCARVAADDLGRMLAHVDTAFATAPAVTPELGAIQDLVLGHTTHYGYLCIMPSDKCNLKCVMCPFHGDDPGFAFASKRQADRRQATLSMAHLRRAVAQVPAGRPILFSATGEMFMAGEALEFIRYAVEAGHPVTVGTNGTFLNETMARELVAMGVANVTVSIDGVDAETYLAIRGKPWWDRLVAGVGTLVRLRDEAGSPMTVGINCVLTEELRPLKDAITRFWRGKVDSLAFLAARVDYFGAPAFTFLPPPSEKACFQPLEGPHILTDGRISPCCQVTIADWFEDFSWLHHVDDTPIDSAYRDYLRQMRDPGSRLGRFCARCHGWQGYYDDGSGRYALTEIASTSRA